MTARFWFATDQDLLRQDFIPTLAAAAFKRTKAESDPDNLRQQLVGDGPDSVSRLVPADQILVLIGTTTELKDFRVRLNRLGISKIGPDRDCGPSDDPFLMWSARVNVNHPDKPLVRKTTVTVIVTGWANTFGTRVVTAGWTEVPSSYPGRDVRGLGDNFDTRLDDAKLAATVNA